MRVVGIVGRGITDVGRGGLRWGHTHTMGEGGGDYEHDKNCARSEE